MKNIRPVWTLVLGLLLSLGARAQTAGMVCTGGDGASATFKVQINYETKPMALGWKVTLPDGWAYVGGLGEPEVKPTAGQTKELEWAHIEVPADSATFVFTVRNAGKVPGPHTFVAAVILQDATKETTIDLAPVQIE